MHNHNNNNNNNYNSHYNAATYPAVSSSPSKRERGDDHRPHSRGKASGQGLGPFPPFPSNFFTQGPHVIGDIGGGYSDPSSRILSPFAVLPLTLLAGSVTRTGAGESGVYVGEASNVIVAASHNNSSVHVNEMQGIGGGGRGGVPLSEPPPLPPVSRQHVWTKAQQLLSSSIQQVWLLAD